MVGTSLLLPYFTLQPMKTEPIEGSETSAIINQTPGNYPKGNLLYSIHGESLKSRNLLIEVDSETRKKIMQARIKLGWTICSVDDYIVAKRCFRCSRFNHNFRDCKGEETCPLCTGSHKIKECTATKSERKCMNRLIYNKHHQINQIDTAHSSLDKNA